MGKIFVGILVMWGGLVFADGRSSVRISDDVPDMSRPRKSFFIGHNVSPTSYTPKKNSFTLGFYIVGYGLTDNLVITTSPWIMSAYNMNNLIIRQGYSLDRINRISLTASYFKSYNDKPGQKNFGPLHPPNNYQQESLTQQYTLTHKFNPTYSLHTTFSYLYFWHEENPYSLRMPSGNLDSGEFILSSLHEFRMSDRARVNLEAGVLGLNYVYPYAHVGASLTYQTESVLLQMGASRTALPFGQRFVRSMSGVYVYSDQVHPEFQAQYSF